MSVYKNRVVKAPLPSLCTADALRWAVHIYSFFQHYGKDMAGTATIPLL